MTAGGPLAVYAADLPALVDSMEVITRKGLETCYGFSDGHIYHGELALDSSLPCARFSIRRAIRRPSAGCFFVARGTHPGNGLTGPSGANAAPKIIRELR